MTLFEEIIEFNLIYVSPRNMNEKVLSKKRGWEGYASLLCFLLIILNGSDLSRYGNAFVFILCEALGTGFSMFGMKREKKDCKILSTVMFAVFIWIFILFIYFTTNMMYLYVISVLFILSLIGIKFGTHRYKVMSKIVILSVLINFGWFLIAVLLDSIH